MLTYTTFATFRFEMNYTHVFISKLHLDEEVHLLVQLFVMSRPREIVIVGISSQNSGVW